MFAYRFSHEVLETRRKALDDMHKIIVSKHGESVTINFIETCHEILLNIENERLIIAALRFYKDHGHSKVQFNIENGASLESLMHYIDYEIRPLMSKIECDIDHLLESQ